MPTGRPSGARWRTWAMVVGTLLAFGALASRAPSVADLWDTLRGPVWWWLALAVAFSVGNKVSYAIALMGSVAKRVPLLLSIEAMFAAAFSNLAVPGIGGTTVQVRYLQLQGVDLASAVAAGAVLANVANVVVQGALFLVALLLTTETFDVSRLDLEGVVSTLLMIALLVGFVVAIVFGIPRFR